MSDGCPLGVIPPRWRRHPYSREAGGQGVAPRQPAQRPTDWPVSGGGSVSVPWPCPPPSVTRCPGYALLLWRSLSGLVVMSLEHILIWSNVNWMALSCKVSTFLSLILVYWDFAMFSRHLWRVLPKRCSSSRTPVNIQHVWAQVCFWRESTLWRERPQAAAPSSGHMVKIHTDLQNRCR